MTVAELVKVIVDNGVTIGILVYLCIINYQFMTRIDTTLALNTEVLTTIKNYIINESEE